MASKRGAYARRPTELRKRKDNNSLGLKEFKKAANEWVESAGIEWSQNWKNLEAAKNPKVLTVTRRPKLDSGERPKWEPYIPPYEPAVTMRGDYLKKLAQAAAPAIAKIQWRNMPKEEKEKLKKRASLSYKAILDKHATNLESKGGSPAQGENNVRDKRGAHPSKVGSEWYIKRNPINPKQPKGNR